MAKAKEPNSGNALTRGERDPIKMRRHFFQLEHCNVGHPVMPNHINFKASILKLDPKLLCPHHATGTDECMSLICNKKTGPTLDDDPFLLLRIDFGIGCFYT